MSDVKQVGGVWLPQQENHMNKWMLDRNDVIDGKLTYQYHKLLAALQYVRQFRTALDVGGHCGLWSMHLVKRFQHVHAFEPVALHRKCFALNVVGAVTMHPFALGEENGTVNIVTEDTSTGDSRIAPVEEGKRGRVDLCRMDDVPELADAPIDFIKLDCEGYELFALRGGEALLKKNKPAICVEQKHQFGQRYGVDPRAAVTYLQGLGAKVRKEISGDFMMSWDLGD